MFLAQQVSGAAALLAGLASFLSPCVLPLIPAYLGMLAGEATYNARRMFLSGLLFVLGLSAVFIALGASASLLGQWLNRYADVLRVVSGCLVIAMGLFAVGLFNFRFLMREKRADLSGFSRFGSAGPLLLGAGFAFGWTPCVGPVLTSVLLLAANAGTAWQGAALLALYSLGMGLPFLVLALLGNAILPRLKRLNRLLPAIQKVGGILLVLMGVLLLSGWMDKLAASWGGVI